MLPFPAEVSLIEIALRAKSKRCASPATSGRPMKWRWKFWSKSSSNRLRKRFDAT